MVEPLTFRVADMADEYYRICVNQEYEVLILGLLLKKLLAGESIKESAKERVQKMIKTIEKRTPPNHPSRKLAEEWWGE